MKTSTLVIILAAVAVGLYFVLRPASPSPYYGGANPGSFFGSPLGGGNANGYTPSTYRTGGGAQAGAVLAGAGSLLTGFKNLFGSKSPGANVIIAPGGLVEAAAPVGLPGGAFAAFTPAGPPTGLPGTSLPSVPADSTSYVSDTSVIDPSAFNYS